MLDEKIIKELNKIFKRHKVIAAYIFGSRATGNAGPLSDYDFAVLLNRKVSRDESFECQLNLIGEFSKTLKTDAIDLVMLNRAPSNIKMKVVKSGKLLYENNKKERILFEMRTMSEYMDRTYYENRYNKKMREEILAY